MKEEEEEELLEGVIFKYHKARARGKLRRL